MSSAWSTCLPAQAIKYRLHLLRFVVPQIHNNMQQIEQVEFVLYSNILADTQQSVSSGGMWAEKNIGDATMSS